MREKDLYGILGVARDADEKTIKKAYRRLARKYHPDSNPGDRQCEQKFKDVGEAYSILSDPEKRKLYDTYGSMAFQEGFDPRNYRQEGSYTWHFTQDDAEDLFRQMFGGEGGFGSGFSGDLGFGGRTGRGLRPRKGTDLTADVTVRFEEAALGCDRLLRFCGSDGRETSLEVHIPAGIDDGKKVRLRGKGNPGTGGAPDGDLLLAVHVLDREGFERKGTDVYVTADVPYTTAILGGEVVVPTLYGNVACRIPAGTQAGGKIRLRGKGITSLKDPAKRGDEYIVVRITVPGKVGKQEEELLKKLARLA